MPPYSQRICVPFAEQFGLTLHDYYQGRYPINRSTKLIAVRPHLDTHRWHYPYPLPVERSIYELSLSEYLAVPKVDVLELWFEWWSDGPGKPWRRLAFNGAHNLVFCDERFL